MGTLTDDMTRLRAEIEVMRTTRRSLAHHLVHHTKARREEVAAMRARFRSDHATMAKATRVGRVAFVSDLGAAVAVMQSSFRNARGQMASETRAHRQAFVLEQKRAVARLRQSLATDLAGARRGFFGPPSAGKEASRAEPRPAVGEGPPTEAAYLEARDEAAEDERHAAEAVQARPKEETGGARSRPTGGAVRPEEEQRVKTTSRAATQPGDYAGEAPREAPHEPAIERAASKPGAASATTGSGAKRKKDQGRK